MSNRKPNKDAAIDTPETEKPTAADNAANHDNSEANVNNEQRNETEVLQKALTVAEAKANENWEKFLAAKAETDNVRKRAERDVSNAHKYALEKFIPELLTVKDSLELGVKAAKDSIAEEPNEQISTFIEGSEMAITMFADTLKKAGVEMLNPEGEIFNPEFHQAITMIANPDIAPNTVIEVVQKGYTLNKRLLRPAMVIVSKTS